MNKSLATNLIALLAALAGLLLPGRPGELLASAGFFAFSGALTNWLAVHMLFERVPGFYGSGVVPLRFNEFKAGIRELVMEQFFSARNLEQFLDSGEASSKASLLEGVAGKVDFDKAFDGLVEVIMQSPFASMLAMFGGSNALAPLREPFAQRMRDFLLQVGEDPEVMAQLLQHNREALLERVQTIVDRRLDELTPQLVKDIVQRMIRRHLGWLVVWGGVVGGLIGFAVTALEMG